MSGMGSRLFERWAKAHRCFMCFYTGDSRKTFVIYVPCLPMSECLVSPSCGRTKAAAAVVLGGGGNVWTKPRVKRGRATNLGVGVGCQCKCKL